jgi:hypothetical protein
MDEYESTKAISWIKKKSQLHKSRLESAKDIKSTGSINSISSSSSSNSGGGGGGGVSKDDMDSNRYNRNGKTILKNVHLIAFLQDKRPLNNPLSTSSDVNRTTLHGAARMGQQINSPSSKQEQRTNAVTASSTEDVSRGRYSRSSSSTNNHKRVAPRSVSPPLSPRHIIPSSQEYEKDHISSTPLVATLSVEEDDGMENTEDDRERNDIKQVNHDKNKTDRSNHPLADSSSSSASSTNDTTTSTNDATNPYTMDAVGENMDGAQPQDVENWDESASVGQQPPSPILIPSWPSLHRTSLPHAPPLPSSSSAAAAAASAVAVSTSPHEEDANTMTPSTIKKLFDEIKQLSDRVTKLENRFQL